MISLDHKNQYVSYTLRRKKKTRSRTLGQCSSKSETIMRPVKSRFKLHSIFYKNRTGRYGLCENTALDTPISRGNTWSVSLDKLCPLPIHNSSMNKWSWRTFFGPSNCILTHFFFSGDFPHPLLDLSKTESKVILLHENLLVLKTLKSDIFSQQFYFIKIKKTTNLCNETTMELFSKYFN